MSEADEAPQAPAPPAAPPAEPALEEREHEVLSELAREVDASVTFQGLRRQLGLHQQALTRTLRRLAAQGLVLQDGKGYQLTGAGLSALRGAGVTARPRPVTPLVQAMLPAHVAPADAAALLSRRWFSGLRWYGQAESGGETSLIWVADDVRVIVRVARGNVSLDVEDAKGAPTRAGFAAARPVLAALAELYGLGAS